MATVSVAMAGGMWAKSHRGRAADAAVSSSPQQQQQQQQHEAVRRGSSGGGGGGGGGGGENVGGCRLSEEAPGNLHQQQRGGMLPGLSEVARGGGRRRRKSGVDPGRYRWEDEAGADREFDFVVVPPDGCNMSGSDSDDSDWSVGWFEPHPADFFVDSGDDGEESFAVLVPSYRLPPPAAAAAATASPSVQFPDGNSADRRPGVPPWPTLLSSVSSHTDPEYQKQLDLWLASLTS